MNFGAYSKVPTVALASITRAFACVHPRTAELAKNAPPRRDHQRDFRGQYPLVGQGSVTLWAEMAKLGSYKGHWAGEFNFTTDTFASFIRNYEVQVNALPVRYGHTDDTVPAAGWIQQLAVRGDWLCGLLELTDRAADCIRKGEYRFTSIEFDTTVPDRVTGLDQGATLFGLALVHAPFIDGQKPLSLSP